MRLDRNRNQIKRYSQVLKVLDSPVKFKTNERNGTRYKGIHLHY